MKNFEFNLIFFLIFLNFMLILMMLMPSNLYKFHPLTLSLLLVLYIIFITVILNYLNSSYWYSYILFLVMIGGLMILFMYFTSLASNEMFYLNLNYYIYLSGKIIFMTMILIYFLNKFSGMNYVMVNYMEIMNNINNDLIFIEFKNLMMDFSMDLNLYMIMYLFFTMICAVLIITKFMMPMCQYKKS